MTCAIIANGVKWPTSDAGIKLVATNFQLLTCRLIQLVIPVQSDICIYNPITLSAAAVLSFIVLNETNYSNSNHHGFLQTSFISAGVIP